MKVLCVSYRQWAINIYENIQYKFESMQIKILKSKEEYDRFSIEDYGPDLILFYGWSWLIHSETISKYKCMMLHPSKLPKYRGGSPLQNQIINNDLDSAVTIFQMSEGVDDGDIYLQEDFLLKGHMSEIFVKMTEIGTRLTEKLLRGDYQIQKQDHSAATVFKRRKPSESEITSKELMEKDSKYLYNKIRMLEDPYPNAFLRASDGKKIYFKIATLEDEND